MKEEVEIISLSPEKISPLVHLIRREKILLDFDLAELYGVEARMLNQAVQRNLTRFPDDFMFQLTAEEYRHVLQTKTVKISLLAPRYRSPRYLPYAFTEQGVAMLSSVLRSPTAVAVNIAIMRTFVQLRRLMDSNRELARKIESLEQKYDEQFSTVFQAIKQLITDDTKRKNKPRMGF